MNPSNVPETMAQALNTPLFSYHSTHDSAAARSVLMASSKKPPPPEVVTGSKRLFETAEGSEKPQSRIHRLFLKSSEQVKNAVAAILPGATNIYEAMHLAPNLDLLRLQSMSNMPIVVAEPVWKSSNVDCPVPPSLAGLSRQQQIETGLSADVNSLEDLHKLGTDMYLENMTASFASAIAGHAVHMHERGFLKLSTTPTTIRPGSSISPETTYTSVDYDLPGVNPSKAIRKSLEQDLKAVNRLDHSDFHIRQSTAVAEPLNSDFPLHVMSVMSKNGIPLHSFRCKGSGDPHYFCGSEKCTDDLGRFTVTGRATGVDSACTLAILRQALRTDAPDLPVTEDHIILMSLLALLIWTHLVVTNATCFVLNGVNKQMFFIRHRKTQTLWHSELLDISRAPIPGPSTIATHVGFKLHAFLDAVERSLMDENLLNKGALPVTFRQKFDITIDSLKSPLEFSALSLLYKVSAGAFLPSTCSDGSFETSEIRMFFEDALEIKLYWDDAVDMSGVLAPLDDLKSPLTLSLVQKGEPTENQKRWRTTLHAKIHCQKQHGKKAFLCHFFYDKSVPTTDRRKPYGKSFLLKLTRDKLQSEAIVREVANLRRLEGDAEIAARIPMVYNLATNHDLGITASFVEHLDNCYPLAIADSIGSLGSDMHNWMTKLFVTFKVAHGGLKGHNVLFDPLHRKRYYVVEWRSAVKVDDSIAVSESGILAKLVNLVAERKQSKSDVPVEKRSRHK